MKAVWNMSSERFWAARVPPDRVNLDNPWKPLVRWLALEEGDDADGCLVRKPDEHAGRVWDNWLPDRAAVDDLAAALGVKPTDWVAVGGRGEWQAGDGWPPAGWRPAPIDEAAMDRRRSAWDAAVDFASRSVPHVPLPTDASEVEELIRAGELRALRDKLSSLVVDAGASDDLRYYADAVERYASVALTAG